MLPRRLVIAIQEVPSNNDLLIRSTSHPFLQSIVLIALLTRMCMVSSSYKRIARALVKKKVRTTARVKWCIRRKVTYLNFE